MNIITNLRMLRLNVLDCFNVKYNEKLKLSMKLSMIVESMNDLTYHRTKLTYHLI